MAEENSENGAPERTRTSDPQLRKLMLYPLSYERVMEEITRPEATKGGGVASNLPSRPANAPRRE